MALCRPILLCAGLAPAAAWADAPLVVEFVPVARAEQIMQIALTGTLVAHDSVNAGFRQGGRITQVLVSEGAHVVAGQPLARVDPLQQAEALKAAEAGLAAAEAQLANARQVNDRAEAMLARGVGTRAARDAASEALTAAETGAEQARTRVDEARRAATDTTLIAPFDGVVIDRRADPGQIVGPAQPVISLARMDGLEAVFFTADDPRLSEAMGARVTLTAIDLPDLDMTARVSEIAPLVSPQTGSVELRALVDGLQAQTGMLGASVRGTLHFPSGEAILLPWTALTRDGGSSAVWVVDPFHRAQLRAITVERYETGGIFVSEGLEPGEIVVGAGSQLLYPGREVVAAQRVDGHPVVQIEAAP